MRLVVIASDGERTVVQMQAGTRPNFLGVHEVCGGHVYYRPTSYNHATLSCRKCFFHETVPLRIQADNLRRYFTLLSQIMTENMPVTPAMKREAERLSLDFRVSEMGVPSSAQDQGGQEA